MRPLRRQPMSASWPRLAFNACSTIENRPCLHWWTGQTCSVLVYVHRRQHRHLRRRSRRGAEGAMRVASQMVVHRKNPIRERGRIRILRSLTRRHDAIRDVVAGRKRAKRRVPMRRGNLPRVS